MQPDPYSQQEAPAPMPSYAPQKKNNLNIFGISMTVVSVLLLCISAGLGYWAYTLNTSLKNTANELNTLKADHAALQGSYEGLQGDNANLNDNIAALQAELEVAHNDLTTAQADIQTAKDETAALQAKIDDALLRMNVLIGWWIDEKTDKGIESDIRETGDTEMLDLFQDYVASNYDFDEFNKWISYMFESIVESLQ